MQHTRNFVLKFGGTSVRDAGAMRRVTEIVRGQHALGKPVVITSACAGVTDQLLECARWCGTGELGESLKIVGELRERHHEILDDLDPPEKPATARELSELLDGIEQLARGVVLLGELTPRTLDAFASHGERLASALLAAAFRSAGWRAALADSRNFIITDARFTEARPIMRQIDARAPLVILPMFDAHDVVVAQGFIGSTPDGITTTIGRGGSDHTGALVGAALGAREIQIWTDVSGILTADPRIVPEARVVPEITFGEARVLAYFGARVIHPDTILPAVAREIPVVIKNSMRPDDAGTRILPDGASVTDGVHSITTKNDVTVLRISPRDHHAGGDSIERALEQITGHDVPVFCAQRAESHAVIAVPAAAFSDLVRASVESVCNLTTREQVALLCMSGENLLDSSHTLALPLSALGGLPVVFVAAGASQHILIIALDESHAVPALRSVHARLFP